MVGFPVIFERKTTIGDVVEVLKKRKNAKNILFLKTPTVPMPKQITYLEPLKVGHGHTTGIDIQIRDHKHVLLNQNLVRRWSSRSISSWRSK